MVADYVWPKTFDSQIDLSNVSLDMVKSWLCQKVADLTGTEDEILIEFILNSLLDTTQIDPRTLTVRLTGFLGDHAFDFVASLWKLLLDAQKNQIPEELREAQNKEVEAQKLEAERIKKELAELTRGSPQYDGGGHRSQRRGFSPGRRKFPRHPRREADADDKSYSSRDRYNSPYRPSDRRPRQNDDSVSGSRSPKRKRRQYSPSPRGGGGYNARYDGPGWKKRSPRRQYTRTDLDSPSRGRYNSRYHNRIRRDNSRSPSPRKSRRDRSPTYLDRKPDNYTELENTGPHRYDSPQNLPLNRSPSPGPRYRRSRSPVYDRRYGRDTRQRSSYYNRASSPVGRRRRRYSDDYRDDEAPPIRERNNSREKFSGNNDAPPAVPETSNTPTVLPLRPKPHKMSGSEPLDEISIGNNTVAAAEDLANKEPQQTDDRITNGRHCYMDDVVDGAGRKPLWLSSQTVSPVKRSSSEERLRALALQTLRRR